MKFGGLLSTILLSAAVVQAVDTSKWKTKSQHKPSESTRKQSRRVLKRDATDSVFNTANTTKFAVDGTAIPEVGFDIGESYAGSLPIGGDSDGELFFWFFPTTAGGEPKEILLWLNGGPGCSSLEGLLQENGPFLWEVGTYHPVPNPWSWHHITNVVWVEQPIGTGFSTGTVTATNEDELSQQFMGFWKNFIETFCMQGYKVYVTGESYAGFYAPYIASNMIDAHDETYFNVSGLSIIDPVIGDFNVEQYIPAMSFVDYWAPQFPFNDTFYAHLKNMSASCGFDEYLEKYLVFPPAGQQPNKPPGPDPEYLPDDPCYTWDYIFYAILTVNPGWSEYLVSAVAPVPYDVLGFPSALTYMPEGTQAYFNRTDVKEAIHAPLDVNWEICSEGSVFVNGSDNSDYTIIHAIPNVIEHTNNVIISHGQNDFILVDAGTLMNIQNMTWNGAMGFSCIPDSPLFVPFHDQDDNFKNLTGDSVETLAAQGITGTTHTERGLTWCHVVLSGHQIPSYQPATAFRQIEFLLGRVDSLQSTVPLSNYPDWPQPDPSTFGKGVGRQLGTGTTCSST